MADMMADADSLHDASSDIENDHSAGDADVEDDDVSAQRYMLVQGQNDSFL